MIIYIILIYKCSKQLMIQLTYCHLATHGNMLNTV